MVRYKVLICTRSPELIEELRAAFAESPLFEVRECVHPGDLVESAVRLRPDVVLWKMEDEDTLHLLTELEQRCPLVLPVLLVNNPQNLDLCRLVETGLRGCLPLRLPPRRLVQAVELIAEAGMLCLLRPGAGLLCPSRWKAAPATSSPLTERELELVTLVAKDCSSQEIGRRLFMSESTVKTHLRSIFRKLGVRNRTEAVTAAVQRQLLSPGE